MKGSQTEFEQQERLFAMLEQKNGEIKHLLGEIRNLEKFKVCGTPFNNAAIFWFKYLNTFNLKRFLYYIINLQFYLSFFF